MNQYKLLTPGPLTTTDTVKEAMMTDHCTWDGEYKEITQEIRRELLQLAHVQEEKYTAVLMQGSGTFGVESVLTSAIGEQEKVLILANGAYGNRMIEIAEQAGVRFCTYEVSPHKTPDKETVAQMLDENWDITHVAMVHGETTTGMINDLEGISQVVKDRERTLIVDAMSTFGGMDIPVQELGIDFLISSANKCIQGVPGFSFILADREQLKSCKDKARSLSLDLYGQWKTMEVDGKWRFTSPTHVVLAFSQALKELKQEGGIPARNRRYRENQKLLTTRLAEIGFQAYLPEEKQGPIITSFLYPQNHKFDFAEMYRYIKERGFAIYPGKVTEADTFRIGNIGEIYTEDIEKLCDIMRDFMEEQQ